jgi:hypothetical protein
MFPDADILVVKPSALVGHPIDDTLRSVLLEVGLPDSLVDVVEIDGGIVECLRTVGDFYESGDEEPPSGSEELLYLGLAGRAVLAVDGNTGETFLVDVSTGVRRLSSNLDAFLRVLGAMSEAVADYWHEPGTIEDKAFGLRLVRLTTETLAKVDPSSGDTAERSWRELASDVASAAG